MELFPFGKSKIVSRRETDYRVKAQHMAHLLVFFCDKENLSAVDWPLNSMLEKKNYDDGELHLVNNWWSALK